MNVAASAEQVEAEALQLPAPGRARLAARLIASLDEEAEHEQAWTEEVQRRVAELQSGQVQAIPAAEVLSEAHALLQ